MPGSAEFFETPEYAKQIISELLEKGTLLGAEYGSGILSTTESGFTDAYDPGMLVQHKTATLYWPHVSPGDNLIEVITMDDNEPKSPLESGEEVLRNRRALLAASVGEAALQRIPKPLQEYWERVKRIRQPIDIALDGCQFGGIPLCLAISSQILQSATAPEGQRILHLWYPAYISPKPILANLKFGMRRMIADEQI